MKYDIKIEIDLPRETVVQLILNKKLYSQWHPYIKNVEQISGKAGELGSKSLVTIEQNGQTVTMESVVIKNELPNEIWRRGSKEGEFTVTTKVRFEELTSTKTRVSEDIEMHIPQIESNSNKALLAFKEFAESQD